MSRDLTPASRLRCLTVWAGATGLFLGLTGLLSSGVPAGDRFDQVLVGTCELALVVCAGWLWLVTTVVALDAARGVTARRPGVPAALRRGLLVACGVALTGGLAPSYAVTGPVAPARAGDENGSGVVVRGLPLPDRATAAGHLARLLQRASTSDAVVVVRPGDTLWGLAAEHLGSGTEWPRLHRTNRSVVGADPDLIHPGQRLVLPDPGPREDPR